MANSDTDPAYKEVGNYAGYVRRLAAWLVDAPLRIVIALALVYWPMRVVVGGQVKRYGSTDPNVLWREMSPADRAIVNALFFFAAIIVPWVYTAVLESSTRRATYGKRLFGLQVVDLKGRRISFGRASGRFLASLIPTFGIGYVVALFTRHRQTLYDLIAGCVAVRASGGSAVIEGDRPGGLSY